MKDCYGFRHDSSICQKFFKTSNAEDGIAKILHCFFSFHRLKWGKVKMGSAIEKKKKSFT